MLCRLSTPVVAGSSKTHQQIHCSDDTHPVPPVLSSLWEKESASCDSRVRATAKGAAPVWNLTQRKKTKTKQNKGKAINDEAHSSLKHEILKTKSLNSGEPDRWGEVFTCASQIKCQVCTLLHCRHLEMRNRVTLKYTSEEGIKALLFVIVHNPSLLYPPIIE